MSNEDENCFKAKLRLCEDRKLVLNDAHNDAHNDAQARKQDDQVEPITRVELKELPDDGFLLKNVLSKKECEDLIAQSEEFGYKSLENEYPKEYRDNDRVMLEDMHAAQVIYERVKAFIPAQIHAQNGEWHPISLNHRFRFCRYKPGGHFNPHYDAPYISKSGEELSKYTFMLYLNGVHSNEDGGATNFLNFKDHRVYLSVKPEAGMAIVFKHRIYHEGERLKAGIKYLMRSDVVFKFTPN